MPHLLLMYGHNRDLLKIRQMVLETTCNQVFATTNPKEVEEFLRTRSIDLVILCHTLSENECTSILDLMHYLSAATKALLLVAGAQRSHVEVHATFNCAEGPRRLLATVERLVRGA